MLAPFGFDRAAVRIQDFSYRGLARLKEGITLDQANRDVARMIALVRHRFAMAEPQVHGESSPQLQTLNTMGRPTSARTSCHSAYWMRGLRPSL